MRKMEKKGRNEYRRGEKGMKERKIEESETERRRDRKNRQTERLGAKNEFMDRHAEKQTG